MGPKWLAEGKILAPVSETVDDVNMDIPENCQELRQNTNR
jgi:hypothetical protein